MLEEFPRKQLNFIIEKYGQSIIDDTRRCRGVLKDLAPQHERETNLLLLVLEHKLIDELLQETQLSSFIKLDRLAQKLHDKVGIQKDFALWAVESWAMALNIVSSPLPQKHGENPSNSSLTLSNPPINISFTQKNIGKFIVQNEIAIDLQMKLMWLRFAYGQRWLDGELVGLSQKVNWENAMKIPEFFNQQNYLGYNDWRLPNIYELKTLIDMESGRKTGYFTDANVFPKKDTGWFWSSSDDTVEIYNAWYINFDEGYSSSNLKGFNLDVRLVRNSNNIYLLPETLYELGEKYYFDEDYKEAFKWYKFSAEQGYIASQCSLAWMYENGLGVTLIRQQKTGQKS